MIFCCSQIISVPCLVLISKASSSSRWVQMQKLTNRICRLREYKLDAFIRSALSDARVLGRGGEKIVKQQGWRTPGDMATKTTKLGLKGLTEIETASLGPAMVCTSSLVYVMTVSLHFYRTPNIRSRCTSDSFACSWNSFPPTGLPCTAWV